MRSHEREELEARCRRLTGELEDAQAEVRILRANVADLRDCLREAVPLLRKLRAGDRHVWSVGNGDTLRRSTRLLR